MFLKLFLSLSTSFYCLFSVILVCWFSPLSMSLFGYLLSGLANAGIGEDPFMLCITSPESHIYK